MKQTNMSFYVTLPSHSNRREFPNNQANSFKIRLPKPLQLTGGGWQVGLSAISLPDARVNLYELVMKGQHVLGIKWHLKAPSQDGGTYNKYGAAVAKIDDINDWDWVVDGVSFMKAAITHVEQKRRESVIQGGTFLDDQGKHTYVKFRWEGEDLLIDNTNVSHDGSVRTPSFAVHTKLAAKMGWLRKITSGWILGPNLQQDFLGDQIPDMTKNSDWKDITDKDGNPVFWTTSRAEDYMELSMSCGWRFTNLNVAFRAVVGDPTRTLHVYSDVAGSTVVGNRVTDLLREIQYKRQGRGTLYFEPLHIQYMSLRNEVVEIIHVQVAETIGRGGDLVKFGDGHTIVTLHFKKA